MYRRTSMGAHAVCLLSYSPSSLIIYFQSSRSSLYVYFLCESTLLPNPYSVDTRAELHPPSSYPLRNPCSSSANFVLANVFLPKDRISMAHQGFGFCEFLAEDDAEYAVKIMNQIKLYGKPIRVNKASYDKKQLDVGANLFVGSLDPAVDENALFDTFSTFGTIAEHPKVRCCAALSRREGITTGLGADMMLPCSLGCERPVDGGEQGVWVRVVPRVRGGRHGDREYERAVPWGQADLGAVRFQEGWQGRTTRYRRRAITGQSGKVGDITMRNTLVSVTQS